jgi:hypothetical protein
MKFPLSGAETKTDVNRQQSTNRDHLRIDEALYLEALSGRCAFGGPSGSRAGRGSGKAQSLSVLNISRTSSSVTVSARSVDGGLE